MDYVRGSDYDKWHWCENCTQYPLYIYQKISTKPLSGFCEQCKTKEENETCQCEKLEGKIPGPKLRRQIPEFSYSV